MREYYFNLFNDFSCKMGDCKHSCCEKWVITIDKKTLKKYKKVKGNFGKRLAGGIDFNKGEFINLKNGRCPFLNKENLCDIMICLGKKNVSKTCDLHPKFKTFFASFSEVGYGVSCEKACELLLSSNTPLLILSDQIKLKKHEINGYEIRNKLLKIIDDSSINLEDKVSMLFSEIKVDLSKNSNEHYQKLLLSLEFLDSNYYQKLQDLSLFNHLSYGEFRMQFDNILRYFIYRHALKDFSILDVYINSAFAIFSFLIVYNLFISSNNLTIENLMEILRSYSTEIEYSENNLDLLYNEFEKLVSLI